MPAEGGTEPHLMETFVETMDSHFPGRDFDVEWEQRGKQFVRAAVVVMQAAAVAVAVEEPAVVAAAADSIG